MTASFVGTGFGEFVNHLDVILFVKLSATSADEIIISGAKSY